MKQIVILVTSCLLLFSCNKEVPTVFTDVALNDTLVNIKGNTITFQDILEEHKGKTVFIDVWASWCKDCVKSLPKVKELQKEYPNTVFVFLSLDKKKESWKKGIKRYDLKGEHYYVSSGWDGDFGEFMDLDWIPRYMIIDKNQNIKMFEAVKTDDERIKQALQ